jgi:hypothetical protein
MGVRSKVYAIETEDPLNKKLNEGKKLKGTPKMIVKKQITLNDYRERVLENKDKVIDGIVGFRTKDLMNYTTIQSKVGLGNTKRIWDGINLVIVMHTDITYYKRLFFWCENLRI